MKKRFFIAAFILLQLQFVSAQSWQTKSSTDVAGRGVVWIAASDDASVYALPVNFNSDGYFFTTNNFSLTRDGGATWRTFVIPGLENQYMTCTEVVSTNTVFAIGQNQAYVVNDFYYGGGSVIMKSTDGGKTWVRKGANIYTDSTSSFADLIFFFDDDNGVIFGDPQNGYFEIYTTLNGGNSWSRVASANIPAPLPSEYGLGFFGDRQGNTVWAGTAIFDENFNYVGARLLQSDNKGATWYVRNAALPVTDGDLIVRFRNHSVGLLKNGGHLYRITDGGTTWNEVNYSGTYFAYCFDNIPGIPGAWVSTGSSLGLPSMTIFGAGSSISYDDGDSWTVIDNADHTHVLISSSKHGYSGGVASGSGNDGMFVYFPSCAQANL